MSGFSTIASLSSFKAEEGAESTVCAEVVSYGVRFLEQEHRGYFNTATRH